MALLEETNEGRLPALVPIRFGRMAVSPFTFFRGAAAVMALDLAPTPTTGLRVQACGDAHLSNFGLYATPERSLVFGINDFEETLPAPWEWDVKRLAASLVIAGRTNGFPDDEGRPAAVAAVRSYREHLVAYSQMRLLEMWYSTVDVDLVVRLIRKTRRHRNGQVHRVVAKARDRDHLRAFAKLTEVVGGTARIRDTPPRVMRLDGDDALLSEFESVVTQYRNSMAEERRALFDRYRLTDVAMKVVGVASIGTHCFIWLLQGDGETDPLFLQVKEAGPSVLEPHEGLSHHPHNGQRIVAGQRLMQAFPDIFLGWTTHPVSGHEYYIRQLQDMKGSFDINLMEPQELATYGDLCGWALARAHARSGDAAAISGYMGTSSTFDEAIGEFAVAYADQNDSDYALLLEAISSGRVGASSDI